MSEAIEKFKEVSEKSVEHLRQELGKIRTGRASASLLESVTVDYYGAQTPLLQLGLINAPEARMLTVQVYDVSALDAVEKAIQQADLGLNPARDGNLIRIPIPALTEERRKDIVKSLGKIVEESRISIRNHRRDAIDTLKKAKDDKEIGEDECKRSEAEVQKLTDAFIADIDALMAEKEKEVMSV